MKDWELNWLLKSPAFGRVNSIARQLRNDSVAGWMDEMASRLLNQHSSVEDVKASTNVTAGHTVESFVEDLRKRVGLDLLEKTAARSDSEFAAIHPEKLLYEPADQAKQARAKLEQLRAILQALVEGISPDSPPDDKKPIPVPAHVRAAAQAAKAVMFDHALASQVLDARKTIESAGTKLMEAVIKDGRNPESMTKTEALVADIMVEADHCLRLLGRVSKHDSMEDLKATATIPFSKTADQEHKKELTEMIQFLRTYHLRPTHAMKEPEALFFELKSKFGTDIVQEIGRDTIMKMINRLREEMKEPMLSENLPDYDGSPMQLRDDPEAANKGGPKGQR